MENEANKTAADLTGLTPGCIKEIADEYDERGRSASLADVVLSPESVQNFAAAIARKVLYGAAPAEEAKPVGYAVRAEHEGQMVIQWPLASDMQAAQDHAALYAPEYKTDIIPLFTRAAPAAQPDANLTDERIYAIAEEAAYDVRGKGEDREFIFGPLTIIDFAREIELESAAPTASQPDEARDAALRNIVANAVIQPDAGMGGKTDCYAVPLDDVEAAREAIRVEGEPEESFYRRVVYNNGWNDCLASVRAALQQRQAPAPNWTAELLTALQAILSAKDDEEEYAAMMRAQVVRDKVIAQQAEAAPVASAEPIPAGCAIDGRGTTYHNVAEIYYQAECAEAMHMWLDDQGATRADSEGKTFSLVGRAAGFVQDAARFRWLNEDHDDAEVREKARELASRLGTSSYFAITRDIDAAMIDTDITAPSPHPVSIGVGGLDAYEMTRLRRLMKALGQADAFERDDNYVRGVLCTVLGLAAGKIERAAHPSPEGGAAETKEKPDEK